MSQVTTLVLQDRSDSESHTFNPRDIRDGLVTLVESSGVPIGDKRLTLALQRTQNGRIKVTMRFVVPTVQNAVINGVTQPTVVRTAYADVTFSFADTSSFDERNDVMGYVEQALSGSDTMIRRLVANLEGIY